MNSSATLRRVRTGTALLYILTHPYLCICLSVRRVTRSMDCWVSLSNLRRMAICRPRMMLAPATNFAGAEFGGGGGLAYHRTDRFSTGDQECLKLPLCYCYVLTETFTNPKVCQHSHMVFGRLHPLSIPSQRLWYSPATPPGLVPALLSASFQLHSISLLHRTLLRALTLLSIFCFPINFPD